MTFFKNLFVEPTDNGALQFFRSGAAGVLSFILDACVLYAIVESGVHYLLAAPVSFSAGFFFNFYLARTFVFPRCKKSLAEELTGYAWIAAVGLVLTEFFMYLFTDRFKVYYVMSKFFATTLVMIWSFAARKFWLYKQ